MSGIFTKAKFEQELERALVHLYDPDFLRRSPLLCWFELSDRDNPTAALRSILLEAIASLRPEAYVPAGSNSWRYYQVLNYRFVEQSPQREVAADMLLSVRQLRRYEAAAKSLLAELLWGQYNLGKQTHCQDDETVLQEVVFDLANQMEIRDTELSWVARSLPAQPHPLDELLNRTVETVQPFLKSTLITLRQELAEHLPSVIVQEAAARQMFLHLFMLAARNAPSATILINAAFDAPLGEVLVEIRVAGRNATDSTSLNKPDIELAHRLSEIAGVTLSLNTDPQTSATFTAEIRLPVADQLPVLVVDDNRDTLALIQRYLTNTRYHFVGTANSSEMLALVEQYQPAAVILDVMLPGIDGWELVSRLRENPTLGHIPVIVSTILPYEELARTLGAAEFLPKPVSREKLLSALDRHLLPQNMV